MKKIVKIGLLAILIASLGMNFYLISNKRIAGQQQYLGKKNMEIYKYFDSMQLSSFKEKYNTGQRLVVYIGRPTCGDCNNFDKIFVKYIKQYNLSSKMLYVNVDELHKNKSEWEEFKKDYNIKGTPSLVIYENKKMISKLDFEEMHGFTPKEIEKWLKDNNLTK